MRSRRTPSLTQCTESRVRPPGLVLEANGAPLSLRIARGRPSSRKAWSTTGSTASMVSGTMRHLDQKSAVGIGDRQRIAALAVSGAEPALEVDAPQVVGPVHRQKRLGQRHRSPSPAAWLAQPLAPQQIANCRGRRPKPFRITPLQHCTQLLGAPKRPLAPQRHDRRGNLLGHRHAVPVRRPRACLQPTRPLFSIASQQPVAGVTADPIALTQRRHRQLPPQTFGDEGRLLVHYTGFLPWHRQSPPLPNKKTCQPSIRSIMSDIYPVQTPPPL